MITMTEKLMGCLALWLAVLICISGAGAISLPDQEKILQIHLNYQDGGYRVSSMEVQYGKAPNLNIQMGILNGIITDSAGKVISSFSLRDPSVIQADNLGSTGGDLIGYQDTSASGDMTITVPYQQDMSTFSLSDSREDTILVSADLTGPVTTFCTEFAADPDCQARGVPQKTAVPDSAMSLIIAAFFFALLATASGLAIITLRRRARVQIPEKQTVLIVDDDPDIVDVIHHLLDDMEYITLTANGGRECLDILKDQVPDLVLLDVGMGPMDGWQTLEQIKKNPSTKSVPVLMLTAHPLTAVVARQYKICIDDYITKPFELDELSAAIENILERKRKLKESLVTAKKAGVDMEAFCEYASLTRHISVNRRIIDILQAPMAVPQFADMDTLDEMSVADYICIKTRDQEKRAELLRHQINSSFRSKGFPDLKL